MTQSSSPSHDDSVAINDVCPNDQKLFFNNTTQGRFTLFWRQLCSKLTNSNAELELVKCWLDHFQIEPIQVDTFKSNKLRSPYEVCKTGESLDFLPLTGDNP